MTVPVPHPGRATLRRATRTDAVEVHRLLAELAAVQGAAEEVISTPEDIARDGLHPGAALQAVLAHAADGRAVGLALYFFTYSTWKGRRILYVEDLFVDAALRGDGLGRKLLAETARIAREEGALRVELSVKCDNPARRFYEKLGFVRKGEWLPYMLSNTALDTLAADG